MECAPSDTDRSRTTRSANLAAYHSGDVSFATFVQAFCDGNAGDANGEAVRSVLAPHVAHVEDVFDFARLVTADGSADLYGYDDLSSCFMVNHVSGEATWDLIVRAAAASDLVVIPIGCPPCLTGAASVSDLPPGLADSARRIGSGAALLAVIAEAG